MKQNYINHIALVLDASSSMASHGPSVVKVADNQIAYLAQRSKELDQETRVTIYQFGSRGRCECLVYDKDVLRLPSIAGLYAPAGQTALLDATIKALDDLARTPELYGEHAFLCYVLTDGEENNSAASPTILSARINGLPSHWTLAAFVPNANGVFEAKKFGFPKDNIAVWDTTNAKGVSEVGETIRAATESFMVARSSGIRGYKNLFNLDTSKINKANVASLKKLGPGQFRMLEVKEEGRIDEFVEKNTKRAYSLGEAFYQLTKPVIVQPSKTVALYARKEHSVYTGADARKLLGLPDCDVKVCPTDTPEYDIFIQSTSVNRKLFPGTHVLLLS